MICRWSGVVVVVVFVSSVVVLVVVAVVESIVSNVFLVLLRIDSSNDFQIKQKNTMPLIFYVMEFSIPRTNGLVLCQFRTKYVLQKDSLDIAKN